MKKWYNVVWWKLAISIPILMIVISMFCRCKSKQSVVTQQTYITDKSNEKKWDSLFNIRLSKEFERLQLSRSESTEKSLEDVTHIKDSVSSRYDSNGNKIGEDKYHSEVRVISEKEVQKLKDSIGYYKSYMDSSAFYHSKYDSLAKVKENISKDKQVVEKKLTKWQSICIETGKVFYFLVLMIALIIVYNTLLRRKKS